MNQIHIPEDQRIINCKAKSIDGLIFRQKIGISLENIPVSAFHLLSISNLEKVYKVTVLFELNQWDMINYR